MKLKFLEQYKHLGKEIYILFWGRIVTSMGSLIWPLLTLILENKLGYDATLIAGISFAMSILQFPMLLLGGRLADKRNRKNVIVICDLVTVVCYIICGLIPLSAYSIGLFYVASVFATIEGPSYDALIADLSDGEDREKAYSLQYLGMNLGLCACAHDRRFSVQRLSVACVHYHGHCNAFFNAADSFLCQNAQHTEKEHQRIRTKA